MASGMTASRMLVVAAEPVIEAVRWSLSRDGHEITGMTALPQNNALAEEVASGRHDMLILTNTVLPPARIAEQIAALKPLCPGIKLLVLSGCRLARFVRAWWDAGADAVMGLPFAPRELQETVNKLRRAEPCNHVCLEPRR